MSATSVQYRTTDIWKELAECEGLPTPPGVATKLIKLSSCQTANFNDIADVVMLDPAIAAKLIKLANSSLYTRQRKTENISQAISLFGIAGTLSIALTFSLIKVPASYTSGLNVSRFWLRSLAAAVLSRRLSAFCAPGESESYYLGGLLQDIGALAANVLHPDVYQQENLPRDDHDTLIDTEKKHFLTDHSVIGAWLLKEWDFPAEYIISTRYSHVLDEKYEATSTFNSCVAISGYLADLWNLPVSNILHELKPTITQYIGIDENQIRTVLEETQTELDEIAPIFDVQLLDEAAINKILFNSVDALMNVTVATNKELQDTQQKLSKLESQALELEKKINFDDLTGVFSRKYFYTTLETEFKAHTIANKPLALIFIDIDDFKKLNDMHGHLTGDLILKETALRFQQSVSSKHLIARVGGEEFVILLKNTGSTEASALCDSLIDTFQDELSVGSMKQAEKVTISAGLAINDGSYTHKDYHSFIEASDKACYKAKNTGKNQWVLASDGNT